MSLIQQHTGSEAITKTGLAAYLPRTQHQRFGDWLLSRFFEYDLDKDGAILIGELQLAAADYVAAGGPTGPYLATSSSLNRCIQRSITPDF